MISKREVVSDLYELGCVGTSRVVQRLELRASSILGRRTKIPEVPDHSQKECILEARKHSSIAEAIKGLQTVCKEICPLWGRGQVKGEQGRGGEVSSFALYLALCLILVGCS